MREENLEKLYTDKEAAKYLRISQVTLWRERVAKRIAYQYSGAKLVYKKSDLEAYLNRRKTVI